jgi:hypothetical protein
MTRHIFGVLIVLALAVPLKAQQPPTFYGYIDYPAAGATVKQKDFFIAGWAFDCATGEHPPFAVPMLTNLDTGQRITYGGYEDYSQIDHLPRPDVYAVFKPICPKVHEYEGVHTVFRKLPPPGRYRVRITWDVNGYIFGFSRDITIVQ